MIEIFLRGKTILKLPMLFLGFVLATSADPSMLMQMACIACGKRRRREAYYTIKNMTVSFCSRHGIEATASPMGRFRLPRMRSNN